MTRKNKSSFPTFINFWIRTNLCVNSGFVPQKCTILKCMCVYKRGFMY